MISLRKIDSKNLWQVVRLSVDNHQKSFVATNTDSLLEAYAATSEGNIALPFAIYNNDQLVGFAMFGYGLAGDEDDPGIAAGNYCIWRFMIDKSFQRLGYGRAALIESLNYLRTLPCGPADFCWLSYEPENAVAKKLYASVGFAENGEISGNETVAVLRL